MFIISLVDACDTSCAVAGTAGINYQKGELAFGIEGDGDGGDLHGKSGSTLLSYFCGRSTTGIFAPKKAGR
jgi:hypothetical protein